MNARCRSRGRHAVATLAVLVRSCPYSADELNDVAVNIVESLAGGD